jgi:type I restriction enzyme M protein
MRKLRRKVGNRSGGRCGIVVPNGTLFWDGICARIKEELLNEFNLHTIVRLPKGVFSPYTDIETNLLFFEYGGPTKEIWYYQIPLPEGRKNYTKTKPMKLEELLPVIEWWQNREENDQAWKVLAENIASNNFNLDIKNPNISKVKELRQPEEIVVSILDKERHIVELMKELQNEIVNGWKNGE